MADCRSCAAPVLWVQIKDSDERVPLESARMETAGPNRYRVVEFGQPNIAVPVEPDYALEAYLDHRINCPANARATVPR